MSKLPAVYSPATAQSTSLDETDWTRELWLEAFSMARRMIRDRRNGTAASAWGWYLGHARRRFSASGGRSAQAPARAVSAARTVPFAASGALAALERQGLARRPRRPRRGNLTATVPYRCARFERLRD